MVDLCEEIINKLLNHSHLPYYILSNFLTYHESIYSQIAFLAGTGDYAVARGIMFLACFSCPFVVNTISWESLDGISFTWTEGRTD